VANEQREGNEVFSAGAAKAAGFQVRDVMRDDFGYEVPVDSVPLPSKGLVYPQENPLHGCETVDVKAMTAKEEDILTSRALIKKGTVITELIRSCLIDKRIDVDSMLAGDRNAIMVALRVTGYGSQYKAEVTCPECGENCKHDFSLLELPIKSLEESPVSPGENLFEFALPVTGKRVRFRLLNGRDEQEMMIIAERQKKQGMRSDTLVTTRLLHTVVTVDGVTDRAKVQHFVRNMPARDSLALRKHIDAIEPGIEMKAWMDCPNCGENSEVRLPMGASFFWPDAE
jgi:ribosomal protein L37AE/L43A